MNPDCACRRNAQIALNESQRDGQAKRSVKWGFRHEQENAGNERVVAPWFGHWSERVRVFRVFPRLAKLLETTLP